VESQPGDTRFIIRLPFALAFIAASATALHAASNLQSRDFGAKGDGTTKDTAAIQGAIDTCAAKGGGTVRLTAGTYLSAPIVLKSNITLQLDKGATLLGSPDHADYPEDRISSPRRRSRWSAPPTLKMYPSPAKAPSTARAKAGGMMRGVTMPASWAIRIPRPRLVVFDHCKHVRVEGVTIQNSPFWQLVPYYSDDVVIRNIRVLAPYQLAEHRRRRSLLLIQRAHRSSLCRYRATTTSPSSPAPSTRPGGDDPSRDITISDCTFKHGHGLSIGSEIAGGARNIVAERIHFDGTDNGIRVKANRDRGNDVSNLVFRDIDMKDVKNPLVISEYYPRILPPEGDVAPEPGHAPHAALPQHRVSECHRDRRAMAGAIVGLPEAPVTDIVLQNVNLSGEKGLSIGYANVTGQNVKVVAAQGDAIIKMAGANVTLK
jgi:hypothetical protein